MVETVGTLFWSVVSVAGGMSTILLLVAIIDRALHGRVRSVVRRYVGAEELKEQHKKTDQKLTAVQTDVEVMKRSSIDMAKAINSQNEAIMEITGNGEDIDVEKVNEEALVEELYSRDDHHPGDFLE